MNFLSPRAVYTWLVLGSLLFGHAENAQYVPAPAEAVRYTIPYLNFRQVYNSQPQFAPLEDLLEKVVFDVHERCTAAGVPCPFHPLQDEDAPATGNVHHADLDRPITLLKTAVLALQECLPHYLDETLAPPALQAEYLDTMVPKDVPYVDQDGNWQVSNGSQYPGRFPPLSFENLATHSKTVSPKYPEGLLYRTRYDPDRSSLVDETWRFKMLDLFDSAVANDYAIGYGNDLAEITIRFLLDRMRTTMHAPEAHIEETISLKVFDSNEYKTYTECDGATLPSVDPRPLRTDASHPPAVNGDASPWLPEPLTQVPTPLDHASLVPHRANIEHSPPVIAHSLEVYANLDGNLWNETRKVICTDCPQRTRHDVSYFFTKEASAPDFHYSFNKDCMIKSKIEAQVDIYARASGFISTLSMISPKVNSSVPCEFFIQSGATSTRPAEKTNLMLEGPGALYPGQCSRVVTGFLHPVEDRQSSLDINIPSNIIGADALFAQLVPWRAADYPLVIPVGSPVHCDDAYTRSSRGITTNTNCHAEFSGYYDKVLALNPLQVSLSFLSLQKWSFSNTVAGASAFPSLAPPALEDTNRPDSDLDTIGVNLRDLGPDTGWIYQDVDFSRPQVVIPLGGGEILFKSETVVHPYGYLFAGIEDADGWDFSSSSSARLLQERLVPELNASNTIVRWRKFALYLRPRGQVVVFEFKHKDENPSEDLDTIAPFDNFAIPLPPFEQHTYVLNERRNEENGFRHIEFVTDGRDRIARRMSSIRDEAATFASRHQDRGLVRTPSYTVTPLFDPITKQLESFMFDGVTCNLTRDGPWKLAKLAKTGMDRADSTVVDLDVLHGAGGDTWTESRKGNKADMVTITRQGCSGTLTEVFSNTPYYCLKGYIRSSGGTSEHRESWTYPERDSGRFKSGIPKHSRPLAYKSSTGTGVLAFAYGPVLPEDGKWMDYGYLARVELISGTNSLWRNEFVYDEPASGTWHVSDTNPDEQIVSHEGLPLVKYRYQGGDDSHSNDLTVTAVRGESSTLDYSIQELFSEPDGNGDRHSLGFNVTGPEGSDFRVHVHGDIVKHYQGPEAPPLVYERTVSSFGELSGISLSQDGVVLSSWSSTTDAFGRLTTLNADGHSWLYSDYILHGPREIRLPDGAVVKQKYDCLGNIITLDSENLNGIKTTIDPDPLGLPERVTIAGGALRDVLTSEFDASGRMTSFAGLGVRRNMTFPGDGFKMTGSARTWVNLQAKADGTPTTLGGKISPRTTKFTSQHDASGWKMGAESGERRNEQASLDTQGRLRSFSNTRAKVESEVVYNGSDPRPREIIVESLGRFTTEFTAPDGGLSSLRFFSSLPGIGATATNAGTQNATQSPPADPPSDVEYTFTRGLIGDQFTSTVVRTEDGRSKTVSSAVSRDGLRSRLDVDDVSLSQNTTLDGPGVRTRTTTASTGLKLEEKFKKTWLANATLFKNSRQIGKMVIERDGLGYPNSVVHYGCDNTVLDGWVLSKNTKTHLVTGLILNNGDAFTFHRRELDGKVYQLDGPGGSVQYGFTEEGLLSSVSGAGVYDVQYGYDEGDLDEIRYSSSAGMVTVGLDRNPDGSLENYKVNGQILESYEYYTDGSLRQHRLHGSAAVVATYHRAKAHGGRLTGISFAGGTPTASISIADPDSKGQPQSVVQDYSVHSTYLYPLGVLDTETVSPLGSSTPLWSLDYAYGPDENPSSLALNFPGEGQSSQSWINAYGGDSSLVETISRSTLAGEIRVDYGWANGCNGMTSGFSVSLGNQDDVIRNTRLWDPARHRVTNSRVYAKAQGVPNGVELARWTPTFAPGTDKIQSMTLAGGEVWQYGYDLHGQLNRAVLLSGPDAVVGQTWLYEYDGIGNRIWASQDGCDAIFETNAYNLHISRTGDGSYLVVGQLPEPLQAGAIILVNAVRAELDGSGRFACRLDLKPNGGWNQGWIGGNLPLKVIVKGVRENGQPVLAVVKGSADIPAVRESFANDVATGRTDSSLWEYTFDALGRLVSVQSKAALNPARRMDYTYLPDGRRLSKMVFLAGALRRIHTYAYEGWTPVREVIETTALGDQPASIAIHEYVWGLDLSGQARGNSASRQAAGGIGGLVAVVRTVDGVSKAYFPMLDPVGHVTGLLDATGTQVARYAYGPFGESLGAAGDPNALAACPFRFNTKMWDAEVGLYYYGYRYYDPGTAKWVTRDPLREAGGVNVTTFSGNDPVNSFDALGLWQEGAQYYLTFIAARIAGYDVDSSMLLAFFSQVPDEVLEYEAIDTLDGDTNFKKYAAAAKHTFKLKNANNWATDIQNYVHSLAGGSAAARRNLLRPLIAREILNNNFKDAGVMIHAFGDSYAHSYYRFGVEFLHPTGIGHGATIVTHGREGSSPDAIGYHHDAFCRYSKDLVSLLAGGHLSSSQEGKIYGLIQRTSDFKSRFDSGVLFLSKYDYAGEINAMRNIAIEEGLPIDSYKPEANKPPNDAESHFSPGQNWIRLHDKLSASTPKYHELYRVIFKIQDALTGKSYQEYP